MDTWNALLSGDEEALAVLYDTYFEMLYEYGMRLHHDAHLIKDCIQDLFLKLWTNRRNLSTDLSPKPYLLVALRSTLYNQLRPRKFGKLIAFNQQEHDFTAHFSAESAYIRQESGQAQTQRLLQALEQLSARQKEILYLRFFEELEYEQIAAIMQISVKGAYKLNARALQRMQEILQLPVITLVLLLSQLKNMS